VKGRCPRPLDDGDAGGNLVAQDGKTWWSQTGSKLSRQLFDSMDFYSV
jgi:hypothetical protein